MAHFHRSMTRFAAFPRLRGLRWLPVLAALAAMAAPEAANETAFPWTLYRVGVVVTAPNGRRTSVETSRLSRP